MKLNAQSFRWILLSALILLLVLGAVAFQFAFTQLQSFSSTTQDINAKNASTDAKIQSLGSAIKYIEDNSSAAEKAKKITTTQKKYAYQDAIVQSIYDMANESNVGVDTIKFTDQTGTSSAAPAASQATTPTISAPSGYTTKNAQISLDDSSYQNLLRFIYKVEHNDLKMYVGSLSLVAKETGSHTIQAPSFTLTVFVKNS